MERDKIYGQNLNAERKVACVGFNGRVSEVDERMIKEEAAIQLQMRSRRDLIEISETNVC